MSHKTQNAKPIIIGQIKINTFQKYQNQIIPQSKKRGISASQIKLKPNPKNQNEKNSLITNIITQVEKDQNSNQKNQILNIKNPKFPKNQNLKFQKTQKNQNEKIQKKSHSHSPNRLLNSSMKLNNGLLPPKISNKKTLVLDLDETLVHSNFIPFQIPSDVIIKIELENIIHDIHVLVRPGVKEFLEKMSKRYEIVIFTASLSKYADPLLNIIDKQGYCPFRLFREHCTLINTAFVKDLKKLGRDLKDIVIVDNSPISYALNPDNGIPILSWFDDKNDRELYNIIPILEFLSYVYDVREHIRKFVIDNKINFNKAFSDINSYNIMLKNGIDSKNFLDCQTQQININIINNKITNYICNGNINNNYLVDNNEKNKSENDIKYNNFVSNDENSNNISKSNNNNESKEKNLKKEINFKNIIYKMNKKQNNNLRLYHSKKGENSFQFSQTTSNRKNNFLNSYVSQNVNTIRPHNFSNLNQNKNHQINIAEIDFSKTNKKKNQIKYSSFNSNNNPLKNSFNKSTQEMNKELKKTNKNYLNIIPNSIKNHHSKSLSYNFENQNFPNTRPKSSNKRLMNYNKDKKGNLKDLRFELNEILQRKTNSKSSRSNDYKNSFKYIQNPMNVSIRFNVKYTSKLIK